MTTKSNVGSLAKSIFWVLLCLVMAFSCRSQKSEFLAPIPNSIIIHDALIIDTDKGVVTQPKDILIMDGRITQVEDPDIIDDSRIQRRMYASGRFVMPGLIDVHAHLGDGGLGIQTNQDRVQALKQFLEYGVTTIFVPGGGGGNDDQMIAWKERLKKGEIEGPDLYGSGNIITAPGSHPISTIWGMTADTDPAVIFARGAVALAEDASAMELVETKLAKGVDALKIVIEDGPADFAPKPKLSRAKAAEIVTAAKQHNLRVFAHVSLADHIADGVAAGVDGFMHSAEDKIPDAIIKTMAEQGIYYVPRLPCTMVFSTRLKRSLRKNATP